MKKFLAGSHYLDFIESAISTAKQIDIAVAFWGNGSETLLSKSNAKKRIICNLGTGGTNPKAIKTIKTQPYAEVKTNIKLHAKIILTDSVLIVGSANFSTNGLHLEGEELLGWNEAAIATDDPETISSAKAWFQAQWDESHDISSQDLSNAEALWQRGRANRIHSSSRTF